MRERGLVWRFRPHDGDRAQPKRQKCANYSADIPVRIADASELPVDDYEIPRARSGARSADEAIFQLHVAVNQRLGAPANSQVIEESAQEWEILEHLDQSHMRAADGVERIQLGSVQ